MQITITVPMMIPRELTPNASRNIHWGTKTKIKRELELMAFYACVDARNKYAVKTGRVWVPLKKATVDYTFVVPDKRYVRDDDNQIAGCKALRDTLQGGRGGIIVDDKDLVTGSVSWQFGEPEIIMLLSEL